MGEIRNNISRNIILYRKRNNLTQKELAEKLGVGITSVSSWERGANAPDIELLFKLCELFGITVSEMYGLSSDLESSENAKKHNDLTPDEQELLTNYRSLSNQGKESIRQQMFMHVKIYEVEAAHISSLEIG